MRKNFGEEWETYGTCLTRYKGNSKNVTVPNGITEIDGGRYRDKVDILSLTLSPSVYYLGEHFESVFNTRNLYITDNISWIGNRAISRYTKYLCIDNINGNALGVLTRLADKCPYAFLLFDKLEIKGQKLGPEELKELERLIDLAKKQEDCSWHIFKFINSDDILDETIKIAGLSHKEQDLENVDIPEGTEIIGYGAYSSNKLKTVILPESTKTICEASFDNNPLEEVIMYDSIENTAFNSFPKSLKTIRIINKKGKAFNLLQKMHCERRLSKYNLERIIIYGEPLNLAEMASICKMAKKFVLVSNKSIGDLLEDLETPKNSSLEIEDEELKRLFQKIKDLESILDPESRKVLSNKVETLRAEYCKSLASFQNKLSFDPTLSTFSNPSKLRENFIFKLEALVQKLFVKQYEDLLNRIKDYELALNSDTITDNNHDKVYELINIFKKHHSDIYLEQLRNLFTSTKEKISVFLNNMASNNVTLSLDGDIVENFNKEIAKLSIIAERIIAIDNIFSGNDPSLLGQNIQNIFNILNKLSLSDRTNLTNEFNSIIKPFKEKMLSNPELSVSDIEYELIRELMPFILKINTIPPITILEESISMLQRLLDLFCSVTPISEPSNYLESIILDLRSLLNNEFINGEEKVLLHYQVVHLLTSWKERIMKYGHDAFNEEYDLLMIEAQKYGITFPKRIPLNNKNLELERIITCKLLLIKKISESQIATTKTCNEYLASVPK